MSKIRGLLLPWKDSASAKYASETCHCIRPKSCCDKQRVDVKQQSIWTNSRFNGRFGSNCHQKRTRAYNHSKLQRQVKETEQTLAIGSVERDMSSLEDRILLLEQGKWTFDELAEEFTRLINSCGRQLAGLERLEPLIPEMETEYRAERVARFEQLKVRVEEAKRKDEQAKWEEARCTESEDIPVEYSGAGGSQHSMVMKVVTLNCAEKLSKLDCPIDYTYVMDKFACRGLARQRKQHGESFTGTGEFNSREHRPGCQLLGNKQWQVNVNQGSESLETARRLVGARRPVKIACWQHVRQGQQRPKWRG